MTSSRSSLLPLLALAAAAATLTAPARAADGRHLTTAHLHGVLFSALDRNGDGVLSAEEIAAAPTVLAALDTDGKGQLATGDLHRVGPAPGKSRHPARPSPGFVLTSALDANHDGVIEEAEIANAALSLGTLDTNHDGRITLRELRAAGHVARG